MTNCFWHYIVTGKIVPGDFMYNTNSYCEKCLKLTYEDDKKREIAHRKRIAYFDKHGKWPKEREEK